MDVISVFVDVGIKSPFQRRKPKNTVLLKKQVKFTDDLKGCPDILTSPSEQGKGKDDTNVFVHADPLQGWLSFPIISKFSIEKYPVNSLKSCYVERLCSY